MATIALTPNDAEKAAVLKEKNQFVVLPGALGEPLGAINAPIIAKDVPMKRKHPLNGKEENNNNLQETLSYRMIAMPKS